MGKCFAGVRWQTEMLPWRWRGIKSRTKIIISESHPLGIMNVCNQLYFQSSSRFILIFHQIGDLSGDSRKSQGITEVIGIHPLSVMNVCDQFCLNPKSRCQDISTNERVKMLAFMQHIGKVRGPPKSRGCFLMGTWMSATSLLAIKTWLSQDLCRSCMCVAFTPMNKDSTDLVLSHFISS